MIMGILILESAFQAHIFFLFLFRLNAKFTLKVDSKIELCKALFAGQTAKER